MKAKLLAFLLFLFAASHAKASTDTAIASSAWSTASTWSTNVKPTSSDSVVIPTGITVSISSSACQAATLTLQGTAEIIFTNGSTNTLTISGDVNIGASAQIIGTNGSNKTHSLGIGGNLINAGTLNCTPGGSVINASLVSAGGTTISGGGTNTFNSISISIGSGLAISSGNTISIAKICPGPIDNSAGTVVYNGTSAQTISSSLFSGDVKNLVINNSFGVTLNEAISITGTLTLTSGAFTSNGNVTLKSTSATATGRIAAITGGSITGNVTVQQYLTAQRAYRLMGHPFSTNIALSALQTDVDVTGSGTGLTSGAAGAFNYLTGVWSAYTTNTQTWNTNQALLLFVRGTPGQGVNVTNGSYTPSAPTLSLTGAINTGSLIYTVNAASSFSNGAALGWNAIGNPYPSPIDVNSIGGITSPGGSGASIYVWNATKGTIGAGFASGGYDFYTLGSSIVIPTYGAFFIKNTSGIDQPISFTESNKSTGTPLSLLRTTNTNDGFDLVVNRNNVYWDKLRINFNANATTASTDKEDLEKFSNINFDLYSIGTDSVHMAVDNRPALRPATDTIPLGIKTNQTDSFTISSSNFNFTGTDSLFLYDRYTGIKTQIDQNLNYSFAVTTDTATQGDQRFVITSAAGPAVASAVPQTVPVSSKIAVSPNPATNMLYVTSTGNTRISILNIAGQVVRTITSADQLIKVPIDDLKKGIYMVQVSNGVEAVTKKIVKD